LKLAVCVMGADGDTLSGLLGLGIASVATPLLAQSMSCGRTPILLDLALNWRTLAFVAAVSLLTGILFGRVPALRAIRQEDTIGAQHGTRLKAGSCWFPRACC
jgi:hypothetical protein